jgi:hypothetical protein
VSSNILPTGTLTEKRKKEEQIKNKKKKSCQ